MVKRESILEQFYDLENREVQIYHLVKTIMEEVVTVSGRIKNDTEFIPLRDRLNAVALHLSQLLTLVNVTFRETKKAKELSERSKQILKDIIRLVERMQVGERDIKGYNMFEAFLEPLRKDLEEEKKLLR